MLISCLIKQKLFKGVQYFAVMPGYKRTEFDEEDTSSVASMAADAPMVSSGLGASGVLPGGGSTQVCYSSGRKRNLWQRASALKKRASVLEKLLSAVILILLLTIIILWAELYSYSSVSIHVTSSMNGTEKPMGANDYCLTPACVTVASSILGAMDQTVDPCTDFYQYACGGWMKNNPLPDEKSIWGTFGKLWQENQIVMKNVLEDSDKKLKSAAEKKARIYYLSCLDKNETMEELGPAPMLDVLNQIGGWNISGNFNISEWHFQNTLEVLHNQLNRGGLFSWGVGEDEKESSRNILQLDQGGLGLPSRDYYLNKSKDDEILSAYLTYMTKVGVLLGGEENSTREQMEDVIEFEMKLANITIPAEDRRDDELLYNKKNVSELVDLAPVIDWKQYFNFAFKRIGREILPSDDIVVYAPKFIREMSELVTQYLSTSEGKMCENVFKNCFKCYNDACILFL